MEDLNEGFLFYEKQEAGLGDYFASCLRAEIERIKISAGTHSVVHRDYYHLVSKTFPFGIFYTLDRNVAVIWAVLDLRRDPEWIREQLSHR